jgi:hypothetical protein
MKDYTLPAKPVDTSNLLDGDSAAGSVVKQKKGFTPIATPAAAAPAAAAPAAAAPAAVAPIAPTVADTVADTEDEDLDALIAQAEKQAEKAAKQKKLAALLESNRLAAESLELTKTELKSDTDAKIEQLRAESKQRIAAMTVSQAGTLSDEDIQMIRDKQDKVASDSKQAFLGKFSVVQELNDQRIQAEDTKLRSELQVEIDRIKDATPALRALSGTPQPGDTVTLKSAADQTIEATVI